MFAVCMLIVLVVPFVLTVIVGSKKGIREEAEASAAEIRAELAAQDK